MSHALRPHELVGGIEAYQQRIVARGAGPPPTCQLARGIRTADLTSLLKIDGGVRRGDVVRVHSLRRGAAEAIEAIAHGDRGNSKVVGRRLDEIELPKGTTIGAVVRGEEVIIAHHDTVIEAEDHVILFIVDRKYTAAVEGLFQVGLGFL